MIIFRELISFLEPVIPDCILDNLLSVENKKYVIIWVAYDIYCFIESYSDFKIFAAQNPCYQAQYNATCNSTMQVVSCDNNYKYSSDVNITLSFYFTLLLYSLLRPFVVACGTVFCCCLWTKDEVKDKSSVLMFLNEFMRLGAWFLSISAIGTLHVYQKTNGLLSIDTYENYATCDNNTQPEVWYNYTKEPGQPYTVDLKKTETIALCYLQLPSAIDVITFVIFFVLFCNRCKKKKNNEEENINGVEMSHV